MGQPTQMTDGQAIDCVRETTHTEREHQTAGKRVRTKMILALWDHMLRLWQYRNEALQEDNSKRVAQFKVKALYLDIE
jgi:hypothetical protein